MAAEHAHTHNMTGRRLQVAFVLTTIILLVEVVGGVLSNSLALLSDAGHVLTDLVALGLAWFATVQAERPADAQRTYGYHRTGILTALANAITLILIVGVIAYEAVARLQHPPEVSPLLMFVSATVGIVVNLYIGFGFRAESTDNLNVRAAMLHVFGDVAASVGVIIGGLVILLTGWQLADPLISLLIAVLIAKSAWDILRETVDILMEATPKNLNITRTAQDMEAVPGVNDVHDLHVWSIAGGMPCLSAHVQVGIDRPLSACDDLLDTLNGLLGDRYKIQHTTIQFEWAGCETDDLYCVITPNSDTAQAHAPGADTHLHPPGAPAHDHAPTKIKTHR